MDGDRDLGKIDARVGRSTNEILAQKPPGQQQRGSCDSGFQFRG